jgi:hypothetical protein
VQVLALWCQSQHSSPQELPEQSYYLSQIKTEYDAQHKFGGLRLVQYFNPRLVNLTMKSLGSLFKLDAVVGFDGINYVGPYRELMREIFVPLP